MGARGKRDLYGPGKAGRKAKLTVWPMERMRKVAAVAWRERDMFLVID